MDLKNFTVYAHRGASAYAPENTLCAFSLGVKQGANGIETDVRRTKDGELVLFHDKTLARMAGADVAGGVGDYTYRELQDIPLVHVSSGKTDTVPRLSDFLARFGGLDLRFAIELKDPDVEADTLALLDRYGMRGKTTVTSFKFPYIEKVKALRPDYRVGWLTADFDDDAIGEMRRIGAEQLCPEAPHVTFEKVKTWHEMGFEVRAWGVADTALMRQVYDSGADGMTVNFPDLLLAYIAQSKNA